MENPFAPVPQKTEQELVHEKAMELIEAVRWQDLDSTGSSYTRNRLTFAQATAAVGGTCRIDSPTSVRKAISTYFDMCMLNDCTPDPVGLANALGRSKTWLQNLRNPNSKSFVNQEPIKLECKDAIISALNIIDQIYIQQVKDGKINASVVAFLGTNLHGFMNKTEHSVDVNHTVRPTKSMEEIQRELDGLPVLEARIVE